MEIMFEIDKYSSIPKIKTVEIEKVTENSVWINGRWNLRETSYEIFFETYNRAKDWLEERSENRIKSIEKKLAQEKVNLELIHTFKE